MTDSILLEDKLDETPTAQLLGVSVKTLQRWRAVRLGPPFLKVGKRVKYLRCDLTRYLEQIRVETINSRKVT